MTSLHGYQFGSAMPTILCPHSLNPDRCLEECTMSLFRTPDGTDYFEAKNNLHECTLRGTLPFLLHAQPNKCLVVIPTLNDPLGDELAWDQDTAQETKDLATPIRFHAYFNRAKAVARANHGQYLSLVLPKNLSDPVFRPSFLRPYGNIVPKG